MPDSREKKPTKTIRQHVRRHWRALAAITIPFVALGAYTIYFIHCLAPSYVGTIAQAVVVLASIVFAFASLTFWEQFKTANTTLMEVGERKIPLNEGVEAALRLNSEYFLSTWVALAALIFSALFGLLAIPGMRDALYVSIALVYGGAWYTIFFTNFMVNGRRELQEAIIKSVKEGQKPPSLTPGPQLKVK